MNTKTLKEWMDQKDFDDIRFYPFNPSNSSASNLIQASEDMFDCFYNKKEFYEFSDNNESFLNEQD